MLSRPRLRAFSLVECILAIGIAGILCLALAAVVSAGLVSTRATTDATTTAAALTRTGLFFDEDVRRSGDVSLTDVSCATGTVVVRFAWSDTNGAQTAVWTRSGTNPVTLTRTRCDDGATTASTGLVTLASNPAVACTPSASCPGRPGSVRLSLPLVDGTTRVLASDLEQS
jgi:type II secretory pathway pseudopilin PulG